MSDKVVLHVVVKGGHLIATDKNGNSQPVPLTERIAKKLDGLPGAYFYARLRPDGIRLDRLAPFHAWQPADTVHP